MYVRQTFGVQYSVAGMTKLLHELNFVYKKQKFVASKANAAEQQKWVDDYEQLRENAEKAICR
jgi:transposase